MAGLKIGDKVKIRTWESMKKEFGTDCEGDINVRYIFTASMKKCCGKTYVIGDAFTDTDGFREYILKGLPWSFCEDMFDPDFQERKIQPQKIVITTDGKTTTAKLYEGKKFVKAAKAECSPDDVFDFNVGALLSIGRLVNADCELSENDSFDWKAFKNDEFFVEVTEDNFDNFVEEAKKHGCSFERGVINPFKKHFMMNILSYEKFISLSRGELCAPEDTVYIGYKDNSLKLTVANPGKKTVFVW